MIGENEIIKILDKQKNLLFSSNDEEKKQVVQEFVESVYVTHNDDGKIGINQNVRVTNGGGEPFTFETTISRDALKALYQ